MKRCRIKQGFMAGEYIFNPRQMSNFEDETAEAFEEAGLLEIVGDAKTEKEPLPALDFDLMSYDELKEAAKEAEIEGYHSMKKAVLIEALKGAAE